MKTFTQTFSVPTEESIDVINITDKVREILTESGIKEGMLLVFSPHTTTALLVNENESGLIEDTKEMVKELVSWNKNYLHNRVDNNAPSHLVGSILGVSVAIPVTSGVMELGTWQNIFLIELDGPRTRKVKVSVVGN